MAPSLAPEPTLPQTHGVPGRLLPRQFYARDALEVARDLLGREIWHGEVGLRITEVEAYRYPDDSANHCRAGLTARNAPMWGPPGHAYVYLCYGIHQMLNLVTNQDGEGAAVLIRSCEPIAGHRTIARRRGGKEGPVLLTGPGKVAQALGLDTRFSGQPLYQRGGLEVREGARATEVAVGSRIGIGYAESEHQHAPWRLAIAGSPWVSHPRELRSAP
ncbi:MAG: DNA-3-methyladenine glycosylase [Polyangiales bacterium]